MFFQQGETGLHKSCRRCHFSTTEELISHVNKRMGGAEKFVKMVNGKEESALHYASLIKESNLHFPGEDQKIVSLLMTNGADVFQQTKNVGSSICFPKDAYSSSFFYFRRKTLCFITLPEKAVYRCLRRSWPTCTLDRSNWPSTDRHTTDGLLSLWQQAKDTQTFAW